MSEVERQRRKWTEKGRHGDTARGREGKQPKRRLEGRLERDEEGARH